MNTKPKFSIEVDEEQLAWMIRKVQIAIQHFEEHNPKHPIRAEKLASFRQLLSELEKIAR
jgi:hypothetical protein